MTTQRENEVRILLERSERIGELEEELRKKLEIELDDDYEEIMEDTPFRLTQKQIDLIRDTYGVRDRGYLRRVFRDVNSLAGYIYSHKEETTYEEDDSEIENIYNNAGI
jgi:hypothetical protein